MTTNAGTALSASPAHDAVGIAAVTIALVAAVAVASLLVGSPLTGLIDAPFGGVPSSVRSIAEILAENLRQAACLMAACALAHGPRALASAPAPLRALGRAGRAAGFAYVAALYAVNVVVVGTLLGAHGAEALRALLPHAPFELAGFSLLTALYVGALRDGSRLRAAPVTISCALALLVLAAGVELVNL